MFSAEVVVIYTLLLRWNIPLKQDTTNVLSEEISLHLLDKPNIGKLTHSVKMEHVMGWKINEGFHSKIPYIHLENIPERQHFCVHIYSQKCYYLDNFPYQIFLVNIISWDFSDIVSTWCNIISGTKPFKYIDLFLYFIHSFPAVHWSIMLCLKLFYQHLSSITWQRQKRAYSIQDQCCIVSTLEYQT